MRIVVQKIKLSVEQNIVELFDPFRHLKAVLKKSLNLSWQADNNIHFVFRYSKVSGSLQSQYRRLKRCLVWRYNRNKNWSVMILVYIICFFCFFFGGGWEMGSTWKIVNISQSVYFILLVQPRAELLISQDQSWNMWRLDSSWYFCKIEHLGYRGSPSWNTQPWT